MSDSLAGVFTRSKADYDAARKRAYERNRNKFSTMSASSPLMPGSTSGYGNMSFGGSGGSGIGSESDLLTGIVSSIFPGIQSGMNLGFMKEKYEYDKSLQDRIFQREDTAWQRKVDDMTKAGISPYHASGQGSASGAVVPKEAPNIGAEDRLFGIQMLKDISKSIAEISLINAQTRKARSEATVMEKTQESNIETQLKQNEELRKQVVDESKRMSHEASIAEQKSEVAKLERQMSDRQAQYAKDLYFKLMGYKEGDILLDFGEETKVQLMKMNPLEVELMSKRIAVSGSVRNLMYAEEHDLPIGQQTDMKKLIGSLASSVLGMFGKNKGGDSGPDWADNPVAK